jgi:hypothetical protein
MSKTAGGGQMQLGMVGLGRMGGNMVRRLARDGHRCVVFNRTPAAIKAIVGERVTGSADLKQLVAQLEKPRAAWVMLPAGEITEAAITQLDRALFLPRRHRPTCITGADRFQVLSGGALLRRRLTIPNDFLGTLQTMCGAYIGVYFLAHMTAVFAARYAGTDTNWIWLTNNDTTMLVSLSSLRLIAHYWVGPIAIITHLACGLRMALLQREVSSVLYHFHIRVTWLCRGTR